MKILIISPQVPLPLTEGGKRSIFGLLKHISLRGHQVDFVAYLKHNEYEFSYAELSKFCNPNLLNIKTDNNMWEAFLNLFSTVPYNISKYHRKEILEFLRKYFKSNEPDIVQIHNVHMAWLVRPLRELTNSPVVLRQENVEMMIMKRFYENQKNPVIRLYAILQFRKFKRYEPKICGEFDKCIFISSRDEEILRRLNSSIKSATIASGIEEDLLEHSPANVKKFSLTHIGNLDWLPNADSLQWFITEILPEVFSKYPEVILYIYGSGNFSKIKIPDSLKNCIFYNGFVPDIWKSIEDKSLLVVPLRIGSGIRIKILEMMAFGINIISTPVGKEGIDVKDKEHILIAEDKKEFILKILDFFEGKYENGKMISNSKLFIRQNYLWERIAVRFEDIYQNLISQFRVNRHIS